MGTNNTTICAISTPPGNGAIAIIRMSGQEAVGIAKKIFFPLKNKINTYKPFRVYLGAIKNGPKIIDEVLLTCFKAPHSYTGEDIIEISCHGSMFIQQEILRLLVKEGARIAAPGEFTLRAFLNEKIDLSQAEGVADLIQSSSAASHRVALNQMRGGFSNELSQLRAELLDFISLIELELDFSEEEVEFASREDLKKLMTKIYAPVNKLIDSFALGNVIKNGVPVAIIGNPNVGKSTLLNTLLNEEKAIVSEIPGTTRDYIEDVINLNGILFRFIDTAGLRKTIDSIETLGIEKTYEKIKQAKVILLLVDAVATLDDVSRQIDKIKHKMPYDEWNEKKLILVVNKIDKSTTVHDKFKTLTDVDHIVFISAKFKKNINTLIDALWNSLHLKSIHEEEIILTNSRHFEALTRAKEAIEKAIDGLRRNISGDLLAIDVRGILHYIGEITGEITTDEIMGNIFNKFCIGK